MPVCKKAYRLLQVHSPLLLIEASHVQIRLQPEFQKVFVKRQELSALFDMIECEAWRNIVELNGLSDVKNLLMKDCYLSLNQLPQLQSGQLLKKMAKLL